MCGIIGIISDRNITENIISGLKRLEYRGYDSSGIATIQNGSIKRRRAIGKIKNLDTAISNNPIKGKIGIGHTRWATHGVPNEKNAHPHATKNVAVVHNGIIENFLGLRKNLIALGCTLTSDTDTELIVHLIQEKLDQKFSPEEATTNVLARLQGAFSLGLIFSNHPGLMIAARRGSPLVIGIGDGEMYLGSDAIALAPLTKKLIYLEDGDWAILQPNTVAIFNSQNKPVKRSIRLTKLSSSSVGKGGHQHFMLKEIYEQPQAIGDALSALVNPKERTISLPNLNFDLSSASKITLVACGTSFYACMVAKYWFENIAKLSVEVDIASEFRYREGPMLDGGIALFISQSGETIDTLAALRHAKRKNQKILSIVNVPESAIARESDTVLHTYAGPEIGVASTKAFTTQLTVLACLCIATGVAKKTISTDTRNELVGALTEVPSRVAEVLNHNEILSKIAASIFEVQDALYLGRGTNYPIALEGALKLKEISYIHAEGYAAGEMKHGPIALIDEKMPVIAIAPSDSLFDKTISNVEQVMSRGGRIILLSDKKGISKVDQTSIDVIQLPEVNNFVTPILYSIPVQLLAYHVAVLKGTDVDQPRNLAKSVTVE